MLNKLKKLNYKKVLGISGLGLVNIFSWYMFWYKLVYWNNPIYKNDNGMYMFYSCTIYFLSAYIIFFTKIKEA